MDENNTNEAIDLLEQVLDEIDSIKSGQVQFLGINLASDIANFLSEYRPTSVYADIDEGD